MEAQFGFVPASQRRCKSDCMAQRGGEIRPGRRLSHKRSVGSFSVTAEVFFVCFRAIGASVTMLSQTGAGASRRQSTTADRRILWVGAGSTIQNLADRRIVTAYGTISDRGTAKLRICELEQGPQRGWDCGGYRNAHPSPSRRFGLNRVDGRCRRRLRAQNTWSCTAACEGSALDVVRLIETVFFLQIVSGGSGKGCIRCGLSDVRRRRET